MKVTIRVDRAAWRSFRFQLGVAILNPKKQTRKDLYNFCYNPGGAKKYPRVHILAQYDGAKNTGIADLELHVDFDRHRMLETRSDLLTDFIVLLTKYERYHKQMRKFINKYKEIELTPEE